MNCGEKISELRKKRGMTQDDLGKAMNVSYQAVSKWERGESQPDFDTMSKIAKLFNVPLGYFEEDGELQEDEAKPEETKQDDTAPEETKPEDAKTEEKKEEVKEAVVHDAMIGVCTVCGRMLKEGEAASLSPKLVCKPCAERQKRKAQQEAEQQKQKIRQIKEQEAREVIGHGFDAALIISLLLAIAGYITFAIFAFKNLETDSALFFGASLFLVPLALFAITHAIADFIKDMRDKDDEIQYTRNLSLVIAAIFAAINFVLFLVIYLMSASSNRHYFLLLLIGGTVLSFTFVSQFLWGGVVKTIFTAGGFTFKLPGFIFTLEIDSIIWMIVVKFLLGLLAALVFVVTTVLVMLVAIVGSLFIFIPSVLIKTSKDHKARQSLNE